MSRWSGGSGTRTPSCMAERQLVIKEISKTLKAIHPSALPPGVIKSVLQVVVVVVAPLDEVDAPLT